MSRPSSNRTLRIIGGDWRRRSIEFPAIEAIRPTPDRVRETLFNWLQGELFGASCLEPFAGSGILSIEALSRGAAHCTILDQSATAISAIQSNLAQLGAATTQSTLLICDAYEWLPTCKDQFDLIFLDPPFADAGMQDTIAHCFKLLRPGGYLYTESGDPIPESGDYKIHRQKRAGAVHFALLCLDD